MNIIKKFDDFLEKIENSILVVLLIILLVLSFSQVILRNFFSSGISWADVFLKHLVLYIGLLGASIATKHDKNVNMDILGRIVSEKKKNIFAILTNLFSFIIISLMVYASYLFIKSEYEFNSDTVLFFGLKSWIVQIIIPVTLSVISFRLFLKAIDKTILLFKK
jgi:TRAP-type C4-dicarboxylate transport system permease small subunit